MGIGKKVVEHKVEKTADKALGNMGEVGDAIDRRTTTGPVDRADDAVRDAKGRIGGKEKGRKH